MKKLSEKEMFKLLLEAIDKDAEKEQMEYCDEDDLEHDGPNAPANIKDHDEREDAIKKQAKKGADRRFKAAMKRERLFKIIKNEIKEFLDDYDYIDCDFADFEETLLNIVSNFKDEHGSSLEKIERYINALEKRRDGTYLPTASQMRGVFGNELLTLRDKIDRMDDRQNYRLPDEKWSPPSKNFKRRTQAMNNVLAKSDEKI